MELLFQRYPEAFHPHSTVMIDDFSRHSVFNPFNFLKVEPFVVREGEVDPLKYNSSYLMTLGAFLRKACPLIVRAMEEKSTSLEDNPFRQQMQILKNIGYPMSLFAPFPRQKDLRAVPFKFWKELTEAQLQHALPSFVPSPPSSSTGAVSRPNSDKGGKGGEGGKEGEA